MKKYYALDYVDGELNECELVYNDQLYATQEEAEQARAGMSRPDLFDVTWYGIKDLEEIYDTEVRVNDKLEVCYVEW